MGIKVQFNIGILGNCDTGKTSLINKLTDNKYSAKINNDCTTEKIETYEYKFITYHDTPGEKLEINRMNCDFYLILASSAKDIKTAKQLKKKYSNSVYVISKFNESGSKKLLQDSEISKGYCYNENNPEYFQKIKELIETKYKEFKLQTEINIKMKYQKLFNKIINEYEVSQVIKIYIGVISAVMIVVLTDILLTTPDIGFVGLTIVICMVGVNATNAAICKYTHKVAKKFYETENKKTQIKFCEQNEIICVKTEYFGDSLKFKNQKIYRNKIFIGTYSFCNIGICCVININ